MAGCDGQLACLAGSRPNDQLTAKALARLLSLAFDLIPDESHLMSKQSESLDEFQQALGYTFRNPLLLEQALTHPSYGACDNARLEFLGDAALKFVLSKSLYDEWSEVPESELSSRRAALENNRRLAQVAADLGIGTVLRVGSGARKDGALENEKTLADAMEAVVGAVCLDGGIKDVAELVDRLVNIDVGLGLHPKTELQELTIREYGAYPTYFHGDSVGSGSSLVWSVRCVVPGTDLSTCAQGASIRQAETDAAQQMLNQIRR